MKRALTVLAALMLLAGCAGTAGPSQTSASPTPTPSPTPETTPPSPSPTPRPTPEPTWPLTGLPAPSHDAGPVIGVKVENSLAARPQTGLEAADVVFVEMVEGGQTRYHALYNSVVPAVVGPVRSLRPMDAAILGQWRAALVYSGGQPQFERRVANAGIQLMYEASEFGFFRDRTRRSPHNLYVTLPTAVGAILPGHDASPTPLFGYSSIPPIGTPARVVRAIYPSVRSGWEWDEGAGAWLRYDDGVQSLTADATAQLRATNVLVLRVAISDTGAKDSAGAPVPETVLTGSGELRQFTAGRMVEGTWTKGGDNDPFVFTDSAGLPLLLLPGSTWVELLPLEGTLEVE